jgi:hypothetical protein
MRENLAVFTAAGVTLVLHLILQWYSWALADGIGHRHRLPFYFLSFPVLWFTPRSTDDMRLWMVLNSAVCAAFIGLPVKRSQRVRSAPVE